MECDLKREEIKTPALVVDLDAMESNLESMAAFFRDKPCKLRPHFKNHKTPLLAWKQVRAGAIGLTCATLREAEILVSHGVDNILIANQICGDEKAAGLADLSRHATVMAAVDSRAAVSDFARAQRNKNVQIQVVPDINIGLNRGGVRDAEAALELAKYAQSQELKVCGIMGYDGHLQKILKSPERDEVVRQGSKTLVEAAAMLQREGVAVHVVFDGRNGNVFGFGRISRHHRHPGGLVSADGHDLREPRRTVQAFAHCAGDGDQHARSGTRGAGLRSEGDQRGAWLSTLKDLPGAELKALHAEHALIAVEPGAATKLEVGQKVEVWVHYSDATVNLHSSFYGVRNGEVEEVYPIEH